MHEDAADGTTGTDTTTVAAAPLEAGLVVAVAAVETVPAPLPRRDRQLPLLSLRTSFGERLGAEFFRGLPAEPGVYFYYDAAGRLLYIGQSNDLRARVGSYRHVSAGRHPRRTLRLVGRIARVEWRVCASAEAAIELERVLLLEHRPPFNRAGVWQGPPWWLCVRMVSCDGVDVAREGSSPDLPLTPRTSSLLEVRLARVPASQFASSAERPGDAGNAGVDNAPPSWVGPLPSAFRHAHASLLRCVMRLLHPALAVTGYPMGLLNVTAPLAVRLPLHGVNPEEAQCIAAELSAFAQGDAAGLLGRLGSLSPGATLLEQKYWGAEVEGLQRYAAKRRVAVETAPDNVKPEPRTGAVRVLQENLLIPTA